jgi:hypothetical protein
MPEIAMNCSTMAGRSRKSSKLVRVILVCGFIELLFVCHVNVEMNVN